MKTKELYQKDSQSLIKILAEQEALLTKNKFKIASKEMTQFTEVGKSKKIIARAKTIIRQREIEKLEAKSQKGKEK